ncbi:hypothetical protein RHSIM_Rhsim01G0214400 [Rhododendron simsii]|uniref:DUF4283 domain-containing protein n=1 Tax=Rhododendron simsii TaxID=118357 RepID=A0A834HG71_RHOSS|nr:hypothetical protein RHSIM_Rhsim01G0214400 [Rhododendron simsii]
MPGISGTDYTMRTFNSDGSEPEMCGNGVRCFARFIVLSLITEAKKLVVFRKNLIHAALVKEGLRIFNSMWEDHFVRRDVKHYTCMVDLLGCAGRLNEALNLVEDMSVEKDEGLWGALLGACRIHNRIELAEKAAKSLLELQSQNPGHYVRTATRPVLFLTKSMAKNEKTHAGDEMIPRVLGSPISRVPPNIDIIGMLEKASVPNFEHLKVNDSDGPAAKQIKELNVEVLKLQWLLAEKEKLLVLLPPAAARISLPHAPLLVSGKDKVAVDTSAPRMSLQFFAPSVINEKIVVQPPEEVVTLGNEKWKDCVAGAFREVIEAGPWHFGGRLLVLKQWHPHMCLKKELVSKIPIWVQLYNAPLELWTAPGLSYVASAIGRPLYVDRMTETCKRLNYAKACVEVDVDSEPCQVSPSENVKVNPKQVWVVKAKQNSLQTVSQAQEVIGGDNGSGDNTLAAVTIQRSERVLDPRGTSDPNKFAVLQSLSALEDNGDAVFLPSENDFTAGLIVEVDSIGALLVQKVKGRAIHNYIDGPVARIILGWDDSVFKVSIVFLSDQLIVVDVVFLEDKRNFFLSVVYSHYRARDRRVL